LILPELLLGLEYQNLMMALRSHDEMKELARQDRVEWSLTHAFFANAGGFVLKVESSSSAIELNDLGCPITLPGDRTLQ
jgi:hypothetical protein